MKRERTTLLTIFFLFYAAAGSIEPVLSLIFHEKGFSLEQVSILAALPRVMILLAGPLWAAVADRFRLHKYIFPLTMALSIPCALGMLFVFDYDVLFVVVFLFSINYAPIRSLCDGLTVSLLKEKSHEYGKVRAWGAVGYAMATLFVGVLAERYGSAVALVLLSIFLFLAILVSLRMKTQPSTGGISLHDFSQTLIHDRKWLQFFAIAFLAGTSINMVVGYLAIYLKEIGASSILTGVALSTASLSAIPLFFLAPAILQKKSPMVIMRYSILILAVRCFLYTQINNPQYILPVQLLHGLTFSLFWAAGVLYVKRLIPDGYDTSGQSLFVAMYFGLGGLAGNYAGGMIFAKWGSDGMFLVGTVTAILAVIISFIPVKKPSRHERSEISSISNS